MRDAMARLQATVARHPRLLTTLLLVVLFVAVADPVAAAEGGFDGGFDLTTDGSLSGDDVSGGGGPTNP